MNSIGLVKLRANILLLFAAIIWGINFVAQKSAMDSMTPFMFNGARCLIAAFSLLVVGVFVKDKQKRKRKPLIEGGIITGTVLFMATSIQQIGIVNTTAGKAGFISSLYIVMVAVFSMLLGSKISKNVWIAIMTGVIGLYLLTSPTGAFTITRGDITVLFSAVFFAIHIICISKYVSRTNPVHLSCVQFFIAGILGLASGVIFETVNFAAFQACYLELFFAGVLGGGVAYTLQITGQKHVRPYIASLILGLESVFAVVFGFLILHETLSVKEITGCALLLFAVCFAQMKKQA